MAPQSSETILKILEQHLPADSVSYCHSLWLKHPFHLVITKARNSKAGDFYGVRGSKARISINDNLNPYLFLMTYLHEVAHLIVYEQHQKRCEPHGIEWKNCFRQLMQPALNPTQFPEPLFSLINRHMQNPKASSFSDAVLTRAFRKFDSQQHQHITVDELPDGSLFVLQGKMFRKGIKKRTRFLCREVNTKRDYLVPAETLVAYTQLSIAW